MAGAQSSVTLYGVLDSAFESINAGAGNVSRIESGVVAGSRFGLRGSEDIGGGASTIFTLESGTNIDTGAAGQGGLLFGRQAFVGIKGGFGQITAGRHYSVLHTTLATYSLGGGMVWGNAANYFRDGTVLRTDNSIRYESPVLGGLKFRAMYGAGEVAGSSSLNAVLSGSFEYSNEALTAGAGYLSRKTTATNTNTYTVVGAAYDFKVTKLGFLYQVQRDDLPTATSAKSDFFEISAVTPLGGQGSLILSYGEAKGKARPNTDARAISARYDYQLSPRTRLYTGISRISNGSAASYTINSASNAGPTLTAAGVSPRSIIFGISHTF